MYGTLNSDTQTLIKVMAVRRIDLHDYTSIGRPRTASKGLGIVQLRCHLSVALMHALSQRTRHYLYWQVVVRMEASRRPTDPEAAEAPPRLASERRAQDVDEI